METASEKLFEEFCGLNGIRCFRVPQAAVRTPDFAIELGCTQVTCEVKQIDPNDEDLDELAELGGPRLPTAAGLAQTLAP